ncbi:Esterase YbfF [Enhygromyxa salina]|uniref:Esterase YbfF n=1 Tax=Enhygromyxa salina TaxID=215803 RepID=A0A2S9XXU9_9BACT|nr:alpha/beta hydrolase [Enhygromyxa salina]PRP97695.1 Esterase YbfF [Enhygromyxa salina]
MILAHELLTSDRAAARWMVFLHGILGRRANWRSFARKWLRQRDTDERWGAVLVDLRDHGESLGLEGERTVAAAGADLIPLAEAVVAEHGGRVAGLLGHSFGGKVAISAAAQLRGVGREVDELWVIDAPPGPLEQGRERVTDEVFAVLAELPPRFDSRDHFIDAVVAAGISRRVALWLATNVVEAGAKGSDKGGWRFGLELDRVTALLRDFGAVDLWPALEAESDAGVGVGLVLGARSDAVPASQRARAELLAAAGRIELAIVPDAGHWVHVENQAGLLEILARPPRASAGRTPSAR